MTKSIAFFALTSALALAACSDNSGGNEATDLNTADTEGEAAAMAAALNAGDFMDLQLGARIVGPQGPEVRGAMSNAEGNFADIRSYVACPAGMDPCDPKTAPAGTLYTYVHVVYPGEDNDPTTGSGKGNTSSNIERATAFKMLMPAHGFTGVAGYSKAEVMSAIGAKADVVISCVDGGLTWTVSAGDGGNQWGQAEPLTFYWQSVLPPAGPAAAYAIDANYAEATGPGPYPAAKNGIANSCG
jgi:hypothetical protein